MEDGDDKDIGIVGNTTHTYMVTTITPTAVNQLEEDISAAVPQLHSQ
jgi:hypothetical protein